MTNEDKDQAGLVRSQSAALSRVGATSLASRGMKDLLAREDSEQWLKRGREFLAQCKYEEAVRCFERGLQLNPKHADLQCLLGFAYYKGEGVSQDHAQAVVWWRKAAEQGHGIAEYMLSIAYDRGKGVPQDHAQAIVWCREAAEQGYAVAEYDFGVAYYKGEGVPQDHAQAVVWWRKAAEQGYAFAEYDLGVAYYKGVGVAQDQAQAIVWWRKAAEQGNEDARQALAREDAEQWYKRGLDLRDQESYEEAFKSFERGVALNPNHAGLEYCLGYAYLNGEGVMQDFSQAATWFHRAANQGVADAQFALGRIHQHYLSHDYSIAAAWYFLAAEQGHVGAAFELGSLYEIGQGVGRDHAHAEVYYRQAAEQGHERARQALDEMLRNKRR